MAAFVRYLGENDILPMKAKYFLHYVSTPKGNYLLTEYAKCSGSENMFASNEVTLYFNDHGKTDHEEKIKLFKNWVNNIAEFLDSTLYVESPILFIPYEEELKEREYQMARASRYPEYPIEDFF